MARKTKFIQTNFTTGEISPRMLGRIDIEQYNNGLDILENKFILPQGGAKRRPGSIFTAEAKDSAASIDRKAVLIPFIFSTIQKYVIELGQIYGRFYSWDGSGDPVQIGAPAEIVTPYLEADLFQLHYIQSADVLFVVHPLHQPAKITRLTATTFSFTEIDFIDGPYLAANTTATTLTPSVLTGSGTLTASTAIFTTGHVGSIWSIHGGYVKVDSFVSTTVLNMTVRKDLSATTATTVWSEGAWSDERGFPRAVTFHEQRLLFGGTKTNPDTFWGSVTNDFENFLAGSNDDDAYIFTIASRSVNVIEWMASSRTLLIGTKAAEFRVSSSGAAITPSDRDIKQQTSWGSNTVNPIQAGHHNLFVQKGGEILRDMFFDFGLDSYISADRTLLNDQIAVGGMTQLAYMSDPYSIVFATRTDGQLLGMTFYSDQNISGWHRHITKDRTSDSIIESIAVIPNNAGTADRLW